jgi:pyruvate formate lyase activating enzyme
LRCVEVCPVKAITVVEGIRKVDFSKCTQCLRCAEACPTGAIKVSGRFMGIEEAMEEVASDSLFYEKSGGGMTVSGGEPLLQGDFTCQLMESAKGLGFNTALDTSGYAPWETMEAVLEYTDLVLFDIKQLDAKGHRRLTGRSNSIILRNLRKIGARARVWLRVPLLPGYNDSRENIGAVAKLAKEVGAEQISLLPYHEWGKAKYLKLGRKYRFKPIQVPANGFVDEIRKYVESFGVKAVVSH